MTSWQTEGGELLDWSISLLHALILWDLDPERGSLRQKVDHPGLSPQAHLDLEAGMPTTRHYCAQNCGYWLIKSNP